jgi:chemotaxis protein CheD
MASVRSLPEAFERGAVKSVLQGDCVVSGASTVTFSTVLGSCISACIRDVEAEVGGMNHFLLAAPPGSAHDRFGASARYGAFAMEQLINAVLSRGSGKKSNLEIKVFGGGMITRALSDIGAKNILFVREFLDNEGYRVASEDLGGAFARRVMFKPASGRAMVRRLDGAAGATIARDELAIARRLPRPRTSRPDIELF